MNLEKLLEELYSDCPDNIGRAHMVADPNYRDKLKPLFLFVERNFANENLQANDELLARFDPYKADYALAMSLLRSTSRTKHLLSNWKPFRDKTVKFYQEIGIQNIPQLLRGLLD